MTEAADHARLVAAVAEVRDRAAFSLLFRWYAPRLRTWLVRRGAPDSQADELIQEIMLAVWRQAHRYDPGRATVAAWIFTIARNKHVDRVRRVARALPPPEEIAPAAVPAPDRLTAALRQRDRLLAAVAALPPDQAEVIRATFLDEHSQRETAAAQGLALGTVKSRTRLAFRKLREALSADAPD